MFVIKRNGNNEPVNFDKIHKRINWLIKEPTPLNSLVGAELAQKVIQGITNNIKTTDIDLYAASIAASLGATNIEYLKLAGRIVINNHHKNTRNSFKDKMAELYRKKDKKNNNCPLVSKTFYKYVMKNQQEIDKYIDYNRDYLLDFFGFKTLEKGYLLSIDEKIIERPQDLFMRVAIQIHMPKEITQFKDKSYLEKIFLVYDRLSKQYYTHATPTLFNSGSLRPQLASCFEENTLVDTLRGPVKIKDVKLGDEVITHLGNVKKVSQIHKNSVGDRKLYKVKLFKTPEFIVTENHKLWVNNGEWKEIKDLSKEDEIIMPKYSGGVIKDVIYLKDILDSYEDNEKFIIDKKIIKFIGIWYSCGIILENGYIKISYKNDELNEFCKSLGFEIDITKNDDGFEITFNNNTLGLLFRKLFINKKINKRFYKYSSELIYEFLDGLMFGNYFNEEIYTLCRLHNINYSDNKIHSNTIKVDYIKLYNNKLEHVYNLGVEDDHSYSIAGIIAKNCYLIGTEDSLEGIMKTLTDCVQISKWAGGIGVHISNWRAENSLIRGTNGKSGGIVPFLRMFNDGARAFNQGGKRNGSFAIYLEPHHPDILAFLDLKKTSGDENLRCRDLFLAIWVSDLFMKRVKDNADWSLFCPDECPGLNDVWGDEYEALYLKYEKEGRAHTTCSALDIWEAIFESQKESGIPYIGYKDTVNRNSMQKNLGTIKSSNLCIEINLYSDSTQYAVCNISSICLPRFVEDVYTKEELEQPEEMRRELNHEFPTHPKVNYKLLARVAGELTENLNNVIDKTWYPVAETARSNFKHRPIGIGIQGLADVFLKLRIPFESEEAKKINKNISEAIYYGAISKSTELCRTIYKQVIKTIDEEKEAKLQLYSKDIIKQYPTLKKDNEIITFTKKEDVPRNIGAYSSMGANGGSPISKGVFHWELYGLKESDLSGLFDWDAVRHHIRVYGVRNSLTTAYMPTASTSQIMGCSSCFEPYVSNIYKRKVLAGTYIVINKYLMRDLMSAGLWNETMKQYLLNNNGSIQNIEGIPDEMKSLYKTVWEIKQKAIMDLSIGRQPFIDQSQSMNLHLENFNIDIFSSMQFYAWKNGLKTGSYYIRTQPAIMAQKFTIDPSLQKNFQNMQFNNVLEDDDEQEECLLCSS